MLQHHVLQPRKPRDSTSLRWVRCLVEQTVCIVLFCIIPRSHIFVSVAFYRVLTIYDLFVFYRVFYCFAGNQVGRGISPTGDADQYIYWCSIGMYKVKHSIVCSGFSAVVYNTVVSFDYYNSGICSPCIMQLWETARMTCRELLSSFNSTRWRV